MARKEKVEEKVELSAEDRAAAEALLKAELAPEAKPEPEPKPATRGGHIRVRFLKRPEKAATQVLVILDTLKEKGPELSEGELLAAVDANPKFISRQGALRVYRFYKKGLVEKGYLEVVAA